MPHSNNQFGDESFDPSTGQSNESFEGFSTPEPTHEPPLPEVGEFSGPESAPVPVSRQQYQPPTHSSQPHRSPSQPDGPIVVKRRRFRILPTIFWLLMLPVSYFAVTYMLDMRRQMAEDAKELSFKPAKARLRLETDKEWQDLGFILNPGDQIAISASGKYFNSAAGIITADGAEATEDQPKNPRSFDPIFPHGCVIARARANPTEVFHIGAGGIMKTEKGGRLQVRVNDLDLISNRGKLILEARTYYKDPPNGETFRGVRDSAITPITR